jgi:hypothetical protein
MYKYSTYESYEHDGVGEGDCVVKIDADSILIEYQGDTPHERLQYRGVEVSEGHYEVHNLTLSGTGSLHRFRDGRTLVGDWKEGGARGMWAIHLSDEE